MDCEISLLMKHYGAVSEEKDRGISNQSHNKTGHVIRPRKRGLIRG
jgi:hypothetical protein